MPKLSIKEMSLFLLNRLFKTNYQAISLIAGGLLFSAMATAQQGEAETVPSVQYPADTANQWLAKMSQAVSSLNYSVSFVLLKPGIDSQPYQWRHGITATGEQMEELNLLNGPGRKVLRVNNKVGYFEPNVPPYSLESSSINGPFPINLLRQPERLADGYDVMLMGTSRVSGKAAQQIKMVSKDKTRYGLNLWLDQTTGMILKMNMFNLKNQLLEQIQVTKLEVTEQPDAFFEQVSATMLPAVVPINDKGIQPSPWKINYLPTGMQITKRQKRRLSSNGALVDYIMLSDGLVDVSLYISSILSNQSSNKVVGVSQTDTVYTLQNGPWSVTVIGKIPPSTADAIASSIQRLGS